MNQSFVNEKLLVLGNTLLKKPYKDGWTTDNPTFGYCYVVAEAIHHYTNKETKSYCINFGELGVHWFLKVDNEVIDYTGDQFDFEIDYSTGIRKTFFKGSIQTPKGFISKRGYEIAKLLELV